METDDPDDDQPPTNANPGPTDSDLSRFAQVNGSGASTSQLQTSSQPPASTSRSPDTNELPTALVWDQRSGASTSTPGPSAPSAALASSVRSRWVPFLSRPVFGPPPPSSPAPSDGSAAGFFRTYSDGSTALRGGALTPDLVFAELGHGRGASGSGPSISRAMSPPSAPIVNGQGQKSMDSETFPAAQEAGSSTLHLTGFPPMTRSVPSRPHARANGVHAGGVNGAGGGMEDRERPRGRPRMAQTRELQESVHAAFNGGPGTNGVLYHDEIRSTEESIGPPGPSSSRGEIDRRGRSMKRTLRSTFSAVEQHASSFFFGKTYEGAEGTARSSSGRESPALNSPPGSGSGNRF